MTIAGSDSGAGAGLQADLKTFAALGVFGTSVVTAVTAQNTTAVLGVEDVSPAMVDLQIQAVLEDMTVGAVKTGMLASAGTVRVVGRRAARGELPNLVVDPVMVSASGSLLMDEAGMCAYRDSLIPHCFILTPNIREAAVLLGRDVESLKNVDDMAEAALELVRRGARNVVVKGGHLEGAQSPDVLAGSELTSPQEVMVLEGGRVVSRNDHGTGCSLSAAIAAHLCRGAELLGALREAKSFVADGIRGGAAWTLGAGHGPLDHFGWELRHDGPVEGDDGP